MIGTYFRLLRRFWAMNLARETHYRANFFSIVIVGVFEAIITLFPMFLLYSYTDSLRGWSAGETIALTGLFRMGLAIYMMVAGNGLAQLSEEINEGKLDLLLIRPVNTQFMITFRYVSLPQLSNVAIGALIFGIGLSRSPIQFSLIGWLQALILFACGLVLVTSAISAGSYLAFRTTTIEGLPWVLYDGMEMGRYPVSFYPFGARIVLTWIMPVAFITTVPIESMRGDRSWAGMVGAIAFTTAALVALRWWWNTNVKHYSSASS